MRFEPFIGIAPFRYRDFFEKQKRKGDDGHARKWAKGVPEPIVGSDVESYLATEEQKALYFMSRLAEASPPESDASPPPSPA